jgi:hypothetical protein
MQEHCRLTIAALDIGDSPEGGFDESSLRMIGCGIQRLGKSVRRRFPRVLGE